MAKFVDKQNLLQYKYFNNLIGNYDKVKEIVSNYLAGEQQLSTHYAQSNPREYRESLRMLNKGKQDIPAALYSMIEDQERCYKEIFYGSAKQTSRNANRYINMLLAIHVFQGAQVRRRMEVSPEMLEGLSEKEKNQKYEFNREDGKIYSAFFSVPKLVLVNKDLFAQHLEQDMTDRDLECLESMMTRDVHYILNVQCESQSDYAYLIAKEEGIYMQRLGRYGFADCFVTYEEREDEEGKTYMVAVPITDMGTVYGNLSSLLGSEITDENKTNAQRIYVLVKYGQTGPGGLPD